MRYRIVCSQDKLAFKSFSFKMHLALDTLKRPFKIFMNLNFITPNYILAQLAVTFRTNSAVKTNLLKRFV